MTQAVLSVNQNHAFSVVRLHREECIIRTKLWAMRQSTRRLDFKPLLIV